MSNTMSNTGKGKDRKGTMAADGLQHDWQWAMRSQLSGGNPGDTRRLPCRTCHAEAVTSMGVWDFSAIDWHDSYEAEVLLDQRLNLSEKGLPTRLAAQRRAETLAKEFCHAVLADL
jgi:hypothetical protein